MLSPGTPGNLLITGIRVIAPRETLSIDRSYIVVLSNRSLRGEPLRCRMGCQQMLGVAFLSIIDALTFEIMTWRRGAEKSRLQFSFVALKKKSGMESNQ
jgi:hypothetical protein